MLYIKKTNLILKRAFVFILSILGIPCSLYAANLANLIDTFSTNDSNFCTETDCFFPAKFPIDEDIYIVDQINWDKNKNLVLHTKGNIVFRKNGKVISTKNGSVILKSGMMPGERKKYESTVIFEEGTSQIEMRGEGKIKIYYNPMQENRRHKYHNPTSYSRLLPRKKLEIYMLVNDVYDLQGITACLYGSYALSQNIDASRTNRWNCFNGDPCQGFHPIMKYLDKSPFSGTFDGNGYTISNLFIYRPDEPNVGLFGDVTGVNAYRSTIKNLALTNSNITGKRCVGAVVGQATAIKLDNVKVANNKIHSILATKQIEDGIVGEIAGCVLYNTHKNLTKENKGVIINDEKQLFGSCVRCNNDSEDKQNAKKIERDT